MSDKHSSSRKYLTFNTGAFALSSVGYITTIVTSIVTGGKIFAILSLIGYGYFGVWYFLSAWKAFSDLEYDKALSRGFISWGYVAAVLLFKWTFGF